MKAAQPQTPKPAPPEPNALREAVEAFNKISEACSGILGFEEVLGNVLDAAVELLGLDGGSICLVTPENTLSLVAHKGLSQAAATAILASQTKVGECLCGQHFQFHASFPLSSRSVCRGVLCVFSQGSERPLGRQLQVLEMITTMAAMVIENARLYEDKTKKELEIRHIYIDILAAVTGGKLVIMTPAELDTALGELRGAPTAIAELADLGRGRAYLREKMMPLLNPGSRANDALIAASEAMTNAVKHGGGGEISLFQRDDIVQAAIIDTGTGIDFQLLPKATLMSGFSTKRSLGMGFDLMLELCDRLLLVSDREGTTIVLEFARQVE